MTMGGPVNPADVYSRVHLPRARSFEQWRERIVARVRGRLAEADFDFAFETVVRWLAVHDVDSDQAYWSSIDIFVACTGVHPLVIIQECEVTGVVLLTMTVKNDNGKIANQRTRQVNLLGSAEAPPPPVDNSAAAIRDKRKSSEPVTLKRRA